MVLLGLMGAGTPAWAEVGCGSTIGPNEVATLTEDLTCPGSDPAITVKGPAVLRMEGQKISCAGSGFNGIEVLGYQAVIQGGTVKRCRDGVVLLGKGKHIIRDLTAIRNDDSGFVISDGSNGNTLSHNAAIKNGNNQSPNFEDGFRVLSDYNELSHNTSKKNNDDGFDTNNLGINRNLFKDNLAQDNGDDGFDLDGGANSRKNEYSNNYAISNAASGFDLDANKTKVIGNTAKNQGDSNNPQSDDGFDLNGDDFEVISNVSKGNSGDGIHLNSGMRYTVIGNTTQKNGVRGIDVQKDAVDSTLVRNLSKDNAGDDLADENFVPPCDNNKWLANLFDTSNQPCIR